MSDVLPRPADLFDRTQEWADLTAFATATGPGLRIAIVSGRRRQGKSYLLRRLVAARAGLYHQAQEVERVQSLARFADDVAAGMGLPQGALRFATWDDALRLALGHARRGSPDNLQVQPAAGPARLVVLDEYPYLLAHSPELPSVIQELYDEAQDGDRAPAAIILCGSALSVMTDILSGTKPLRGRAQVDLTIGPFDFRRSREYWGIDDPQVAFLVDAVLGGTAGYKPLIPKAPPRTAAGLRDWLATSVLNPAHALFNETDYLLREDPRIRDKAPYNSVLSAIASGMHSHKQIGAALGRNASQLRHPLDVLESAGFICRLEDMLVDRRPTYRLADPIVRFAEVVTEPNRTLLEERNVAQAWARSEASLSSRILGPHFEHLARQWTARYAPTAWDLPLGDVGSTVINDPGGRAQHEIDVIALAGGARRRDVRAPIAILGEAKATNQPRTTGDLARLEHIRALLAARGRDVCSALLVVFSRTGHDADLVRAATRRDDVRLVGLPVLYDTTPLRMPIGGATAT
jgi:AAA+ ATPase superfamily predicted ATPase